MNSLSKHLKDSGYDAIDGPVRNHKLLQLWCKKPFNENELYYNHVTEAFKSEIVLQETENTALTVNASHSDSYAFNIGITVLEDVLKASGLGHLEISNKVKKGKTVKISYDHSVTREVPVGLIENFLSSADFYHSNPTLLKNANRNNLILITGILCAKNIKIEIDTEFSVDSDTEVSLKSIADAKVNFDFNQSNKITMTSEASTFFPVAVKANRLDFDKGKFSKITLITDNLNLY